MEFANLKDLEELFALCRKKGIQSLKLGDVEVVLGDEPQKRSYRKAREASDTDVTSEGGLTDQELLMWSAVGSDPESSPE